MEVFFIGLFLGRDLYNTWKFGFFLDEGLYDLCLICRSKKTHGLPVGQTTT